MNYSGTITQLDIKFEECDFYVTDAVVAKDRISIDWREHDVGYNAILKSSDGVLFHGNYRASGSEWNPHWKMQGTKYTATDDGVLVILKWWQADSRNEGVFLIELEPK